MANYWFVWVHHGKCTFNISGKDYTMVGPNGFLLMPPGQTVSVSNNHLEPTLLYNFAFDIGSFPADWPAQDQWPVARQMPHEDIVRPLYEYILGNAPDSYVRGDANSHLPSAIEAAIETVLATFISGAVERPLVFGHIYPAAVQRVLHWMSRFMSTTPGKKVCLVDMAAISGVSSGHLCRMFQRYLGYPPLEVLYLYRLTRSLINLRSGQKLEALADELGFANPGHYVRRFTGLFGKSPGQMRTAMAKGYRPKLPKLPGM